MSRLYLSNPCAFSCYNQHTVVRAQSAPGFPCALFGKRGTMDWHHPGEIAPRECGLISAALFEIRIGMLTNSSLRGANGSRERAPDDRLRVPTTHDTRQDLWWARR